MVMCIFSCEEKRTPKGEGSNPFSFLFSGEFAYVLYKILVITNHIVQC